MFVFHGCRWCLFFIKQNNFSNNIETEDLAALEEKKKKGINAARKKAHLFSLKCWTLL